jgi:hypothetical protein
LAARKAPGPRAGVDASLLQAALIGYEQMKRDVEEKIASIRSRLGSGGTAEVPVARRTMSAGARRKIAAAQKKRWALAKAKQVRPEPAKPGPAKPEPTKSKTVKPKRAMSAAGRRRIAAAQKKRWAAIKAKKKAA